MWLGFGAFQAILVFLYGCFILIKRKKTIIKVFNNTILGDVASELLNKNYDDGLDKFLLIVIYVLLAGSLLSIISLIAWVASFIFTAIIIVVGLIIWYDDYSRSNRKRKRV